MACGQDSRIIRRFYPCGEECVMGHDRDRAEVGARGTSEPLVANGLLTGGSSPQMLPHTPMVRGGEGFANQTIRHT